MTACRHSAAAAAITLLWAAQPAYAAEGGFSFYLPGNVGDIAIAQAPEAGLQVANAVFVQRGDAGAAVLQGRVKTWLTPTE
jgi:hypothetical protein